MRRAGVASCFEIAGTKYKAADRMSHKRICRISSCNILVCDSLKK